MRLRVIHVYAVNARYVFWLLVEEEGGMIFELELENELLEPAPAYEAQVPV